MTVRTPRCRSCDAPVTWARTERGKKMPVDADPVDDGNVVIRNGLALVVPPAAMEPNELRYTSHFATCRFAAQHRGGARRAADL